MKSNVKAGGILGLVQRICRNLRRKGDTWYSKENTTKRFVGETGRYYAHFVNYDEDDILPLFLGFVVWSVHTSSKIKTNAKKYLMFSS